MRAFVAIFVEDPVHRWAAAPARVAVQRWLADRSTQRRSTILGRFASAGSQLKVRAGDRLGVGLAQPIANVDRHEISVRDDARPRV